MMDDIKSGKINCVIVKDLSRLRREYIETGRYLCDFFPAYGVRFIAINDNIDTLKDNAKDLIVSVKSVFNDAYCRDISLKISEHLNTMGVLSPLEYKKDRGLPHPKGGYADISDAKWSAKTVIRILSDETYTGTLVQGKQGTLNYKIKDVIEKPESEWKRVTDAHDAIISRHDFELAQRVMRFDSRTSVGGDKTNTFSGILICDSCGGRMTCKSVPYKGKSEYQTAMKNKYAADEARLRDAITILQKKREDTFAGKSERLQWAERFKQFEDSTELDRQTVVNLIQSIRVISKTELQITYIFQDEYESVLKILGAPAQAQRSGLRGEMRSGEACEESALAGSERSEARDDEVA